MLNVKPALSLEAAKAIGRLASLASLDAADITVLGEAASRVRSVAARRDMIIGDSTAPTSLLIVEGWGFRSSLLADGRRQILSIILPGDVIHTLPRGSVQPRAVTALTNLSYCSLPDLDPSRDTSGLDKALAVSQLWDVDYLYRQIARLGRLSALERIVDWLLEMCERLILAGQCTGLTFPLPLTQEAIADVLGLTSVHVNRTLMTLRRNKLIHVEGGYATILDRTGCNQLIGPHK